jgi:hypothetical protein
MTGTLVALALALALAAPALPRAEAPPASTPKGPKELDQAKKLGRQGLVKIAPKLGSRAEKLAKDKGGDVVDRAVDLAAEAAGLVPKKK